MEDLFALTQKPIVFLDLETTGLNAATDRIIEIAAVRWDESGRRTYAQIVNPGARIPREVTRITGITQAMVRDGQPIEKALRNFFDQFLADEPIVVAHNAPFDLGFLDEELRRIGFPPFTGPVACTLRLSRKYIATRTGRHRLEDVAAALDISFSRGHRALTDVEACEQIFLALWPQIGQEKRKPWRRRPIAAAALEEKPSTRQPSPEYVLEVDLSKPFATPRVKPKASGCATAVVCLALIVWIVAAIS